MACGEAGAGSQTIADFRRQNGSAIQKACAQFVVLCRRLVLFGAALPTRELSRLAAPTSVIKGGRLVAGDSRRAHPPEVAVTRPRPLLIKP